ncbi:MAG: bifunctional UDP-4-amino-4-deoxy-L-arabinose formyltransferase/UDP-glucuronic acid oxidase ArnA [Planctomycetes bacterium]|nr:bifunctional UDP-4-amino-4-deoxy-L-arabinose formyltransferase/UDP-glucuronic acid oxidase ArnA [Planctomycetota bacterium]
MRAIVLAYNDIGITGLEALLRHGVEVVAVFTHCDDPSENTWFGSVAEFAAAHGLPVYAPEDLGHPLWIQRIRDLEPDLLFSFYYRKMVCEEVLALPKHGAFNLHGSLLPAYRGRCPINWVLVNGEEQTGVTLHHMVKRPDAGDVVGQRAIPIDAEDTALSLMQKANAAAGELLDELVPQILAGSAPRTPQDPASASYYGGRRPEDGLIDWSRSGEELRNQVRALTRPWPGAFTHAGRHKLFVWKARVVATESGEQPGTVLSTSPLVVACGVGALELEFGQSEEGVYAAGAQLAADLNMVPGLVLGESRERRGASRKRKCLILGVNGFIGCALSEALLARGGWEVYGLDIHTSNMGDILGHPDFHFLEGDITIHNEWIEYHVSKCDVVLPLVAIATPIEYMRNPLRVFELDFEQNLKVIRYCAQYGRRVVFPSTSEVYGMCTDEVFDEDDSNFVLGPVKSQRWIYSCSKQLLDRVIWAYGQQRGLRFSLFRPFNWIGPRLDSLDSARIGSSRAITQMILNLVEGSPIQLIDGGEQRRCFTDSRDGIECLVRIVENEGERCDGGIFNIGNPENDLSIAELAQLLVDNFERHPLRDLFPPFAGFQKIESKRYYGDGYQDVQFRKPSIANARKLVSWTPEIATEEAVSRTLDWFLQDRMQALTPVPPARKALPDRRGVPSRR